MITIYTAPYPPQQVGAQSNTGHIRTRTHTHTNRDSACVRACVCVCVVMKLHISDAKLSAPWHFVYGAETKCV